MSNKSLEITEEEPKKTNKKQQVSIESSANRLILTAIKGLKTSIKIKNGFNPKKISSSLTIAMTSVLSGYWILPEAFNTNRNGYNDEISALFIFISVLLFSSMSSNLPSLCRKLKKFISAGRLNVISSTGAGLSLGVGLASLTPALFSLLDGGILFGTTLLGTIGGMLYNKIHKVSYCNKCNTKGSCHQKICRNCRHIYHPLENIEESDSFILDGYDLTSYFSHQDLSFFDSKLLVEENISEWEVYMIDGVPKVDKESFFNWVNENKKKILSYKNSANKLYEEDYFEEYMESNSL